MKNESNKVIEVRELTKRFGDVTAVNQISFAVTKREIFGFLGPNGAGKTTTFRMLTRLITPDSGDVLIDGVDIMKNPIKAKMKIGVIPEMGNIYVDLTAEQNIILSGRFYGIALGELDCRDLLVITWDREGEEEFKGRDIRFVPLWQWLHG